MDAFLLPRLPAPATEAAADDSAAAAALPTMDGVAPAAPAQPAQEAAPSGDAGPSAGERTPQSAAPAREG